MVDSCKTSNESLLEKNNDISTQISHMASQVIHTSTKQPIILPRKETTPRKIKQ